MNFSLYLKVIELEFDIPRRVGVSVSLILSLLESDEYGKI